MYTSMSCPKFHVFWRHPPEKGGNGCYKEEQTIWVTRLIVILDNLHWGKSAHDRYKHKQQTSNSALHKRVGAEPIPICFNMHKQIVLCVWWLSTIFARKHAPAAVLNRRKTWTHWVIIISYNIDLEKGACGCSKSQKNVNTLSYNYFLHYWLEKRHLRRL